MNIFLFIFTLLLLSQLQAQTILLTPLLPASAFQNEFYQVRFRVRNLVGARFQFKNVPSFFTASSQGLISGVPTKQGLYSIEVVYFNQTYRDSKEVIIEVRRGTKLLDYKSETQQGLMLESKLKPKEEYLFTYNQNDELTIQLNITNGIAPFKFEPIYIPTQLQFNNKTGTISGAFHKYGDYLLGIKVKDGKENEVQLLIKITVNLKKDKVPKPIFYQRSLIQLNFQLKGQTNPSNKNNNVISTNNAPNIVTSNDNKNTNNAIIVPGGSINIINNEQPKNNPVQNIVNPTQPSIPSVPEQVLNKPEVPTQKQTQKPILSPNDINPTVNKNPQSQPIIPQVISKSAQTDQIITTENILNKNIITDQTNLSKIQQQKDSLNLKLQQSKNELTACYNNVQITRKTVQDLLNSYNQQSNKVDTLKNELQQLKTKSHRASTDLTQKLDKLKLFQIEKSLAQKQYNRSLLSYENVNFAYKGSLNNININLQNTKNKQNQIDKNKKQLDSLYKTLDEALTLNVKLENQKNQLNQQIKNGVALTNKVDTSKVNFGGCENYRYYQKSIGVGQVNKVMEKSYLLTNNQFVTFGDCTEHVKSKPGDIIQWKGYLWKGSVSALTIKKLK